MGTPLPRKGGHEPEVNLDEHFVIIIELEVSMCACSLTYRQYTHRQTHRQTDVDITYVPSSAVELHLPKNIQSRIRRWLLNIAFRYEELGLLIKLSDSRLATRREQDKPGAFYCP